MYLKALEIQGFKSFPDKTVLNFGEDITAIVGPNGSGKSNISDAIRWVMGEQNSRQLRGAKMEDVIFGGTEKRNQMGFAQVTLVIDNTEHIFPTREEAEVAVTRRYYRSGESEYYINKQSVRLKDVNELFMDTGMGREGYSIIGQGKIDEILSVKSGERREIFEEAAGISKYRHRKEESERKLERTEENLVRINDKIAELELQVEPLRAQAETAKKYLPTCYQGMGTRAAAQGNYDEAIANLSKAAEVAELYGNVAALKKANTILAKVYQAQGGTAFNNKDYAAAAEIFAKGYAADPKNTQMALWLGTCYCELKDYDKGMEILEKVAGMQGPKFEADAAEANRLLTLYTNNRVAELQTANDQDGIIAMADKMLEQNPANALAQKIRLQAYLTKKDYAKVIELGEAAAAAQPDETEKSDVYFILGAAYNAKEMKPQAIEALKKVTAGDNVAAAQKSVAELSK